MTLASPGAVALQLGAISVRWYGIMFGCGFILAAVAAIRLARQENIDADRLLNCALISFIAGIIGARLYFVALSWPFFAQHPDEIFKVWLGGLSIHGGIIGATIAAYLYTRLRALPFLKVLDIGGAIVPVAQAVGRWGNFFNSEAFGRPVSPDFPLKLYIPPENRPAAFAGFAYFQPTFLYESVFDLAMFLLLYLFLYRRLRKYPGLNFLAYIFLYSIGRALIEPMRTDSIMVGGAAAPLVVSIFLVLVSAAAMAIVYRHYRKRSSD